MVGEAIWSKRVDQDHSPGDSGFFKHYLELLRDSASEARPKNVKIFVWFQKFIYEHDQICSEIRD